jgi:hypothetical protein
MPPSTDWRDNQGAVDNAASRPPSPRKDTPDVPERLFLPAKAAGLCLFEGPDADQVTAVNQQGGVPFTDVVEVIEWRPPLPT